jgi:hypothetical protein
VEILKIKLTESEKTQERAEQLMNYYIPEFITGNIDAWEEYNNDLANYMLYNNQLEDSEFKSYCDPLGVDDDLLKISNKIKPYNIGAKNIDVLLGEEIKRNDRFSAMLIGESGNFKKNLELAELYKQSVQAQLAKIIAIKQVELGQMKEEEAAKYMEYLQSFANPSDIDVGSYQSELEILANKIINYGYYSQSIVKKKNDGFFHSLISDKEIIYVGEVNGKPAIKVENPLFVFFDKSPDVEMIQNGNHAGKIAVMTIQDVITEYEDELSEQALEDLQERLYGGSVAYGKPEKKMNYHEGKTLTQRHLRNLSSFRVMNEEEQKVGLYGPAKHASGSYDDTLVEVIHFEWKWLRKVGFLESTDEYGEITTNLVTDDYPVPKNAFVITYTNRHGRTVKRYEWVDEISGPKALENMWIPDRWELTRIDGQYFTKFRRVPNQHISLDDPFTNPLSYHGRRYTATNAKGISAMGRQKPYVFLYIIIMYQIGELISRNYGPIINIDTSQIANDLGNGDIKAAVPKTLAYLQKGYNFYNSLGNSQGGGAQATRPQPGSVSNMSSTNDILNLVQLLQWLDLEAGMSIGVSPQRKAQFSANSNVSDNQQSITQSSHITEKRFFLHNELWSSILETYVNNFRRWAKKTIAEGKSLEINYILPDKSRDVLKMTDVDFSKVNIFTTNSAADNDYVEQMKELALVFGQNGGSIEDISNILLARARGTSPEEVHKLITINERKRNQLAQQNAEQQDATKKEVIQMNIDAREDVQAHEIEKIRVTGEENRLTESVKASMSPKK